MSINKQFLEKSFGLEGRPDVLIAIKTLIRETLLERADFGRTFSKQNPSMLNGVRDLVIRSFPEVFKDPSLGQKVLINRVKAAKLYGAKIFTLLRHNKKVMNQGLAPSGGSGIVRGSRERSWLGSPCVLHPRDPPAISASSSSVKQPPPTSTPSPAAQPTLLTHRSHEVMEFLCACDLSMVSHLNSFLGVGCHNRDFLATVARWPEGEIEGFLKRVSDFGLGSESGVGLTIMEELILKRNFRVYFAVDSGDGQ